MSLNQLIALLLLFAGLPRVSQAGALDFTRDVRPIFSENCFHCHGFDAKARKADLRMDDETSAKKFITPGDAAKSELIHRLETDDPDELMPPKKSHRSLNQKQIETVRQWINQGAKWGGHWAFQAVPGVQKNFGGKNPLDALVDQKLAAEKLTPNPRAAKHILIRRATLDLTGLPPTPDPVKDFLDDDSADAWEKVIDRLLASPHYGERMAWDWLDVARYADSNGYQGDRERTMWPWRDWVVDAFNRNLPFDQFTLWQLAGDLLENATEEQILATGFCRNHMINGEGGRIAEENRVDYVFDMTETMATVWLGLTVNCCRCHDHKFDPLTQKEYYQLTAFFNQTPVDGSGGDPQTKPALTVATEPQKSKEKELTARFEEARKAEADWFKTITPKQAEWEQTYQATTQWTPLTPLSAKATKAALAILPDQSVLATGANPDRETHTVTFASGTGFIKALKLEALQHESFTNQGRGLARSDSGNFVLSEFEVRADGKLVKISSATASHEQGGFPIKQSYDGNPGSGWAVLKDARVDQPHEAVFVLEQPVSGPLEVILRHDTVHKHHFIGRFRLSATHDPSPRLGPGDEAVMAAIKTPLGQRNKDQAKLVTEAFRASDPRLRELENQTKAAKAALDAHQQSIPKVMVMGNMPTPRKTYLLNQGLYDSPGDEVQAAVPAFLSQLDGTRPADRLALARWLVSGNHPLTALVTVNRFWQMIFGTGLVKTVEDFGVQSEYPVHPELLDWLAGEFVASGWDLKRLLRTILTSETYQRSSHITSPDQYERDPMNRLLARGARFRMPSWMIRDQALAVSGLRNPAIGGPGFNGYQPPGIWEEATFGNKKFSQATGDDLYRRSLYVFWRRIVGPTMFFAAGKRQVCEVQIARTNTPMHALATLNDVTYVEAARHLAEVAMNAEGDDAARFALISNRVLARAPGSREMEIWQRNLERGRETFQIAEPDARALLKMGDSKRDESLDPSDHAAWTNFCLMLLNLDETLNKE